MTIIIALAVDPELLLPFHHTELGSYLAFDRSAAPISDTWPIVDFDPPDFPWMLTPAKAQNDRRLRPWLVLVVLEKKKCGLPRMVSGENRCFKGLPNLNPGIFVSIGRI